jgi:hypothetical protein
MLLVFTLIAFGAKIYLDCHAINGNIIFDSSNVVLRDFNTHHPSKNGKRSNPVLPNLNYSNAFVQTTFGHCMHTKQTTKQNSHQELTFSALAHFCILTLV